MKANKILSICLVMMLSLTIPREYAFAEEISVASSVVNHQHTGQTGSCYKPVAHSHKGNTTSGGVCYVAIPHSHTSSCYKTVDAQYHSGSDPVYYDSCGCSHQKHYYACSVCGSVKSGQTNYSGGCTKGHSLSDNKVSDCCTKQQLICSKTNNGYKLNCSKTIDGYSLVCTKGTSEVASLSMHKNKEGATYTLTVVPSLKTGVTVTSYRWSTGSTSSSCEVTANGSYTCEVSISDGGIARTTSLSYNVTDYDTQAPVVIDIEVSTERLSSLDFSVNASDNIGVSEYMATK